MRVMQKRRRFRLSPPLLVELHKKRLSRHFSSNRTFLSCFDARPVNDSKTTIYAQVEGTKYNFYRSPNDQKDLMKSFENDDRREVFEVSVPVSASEEIPMYVVCTTEAFRKVPGKVINPKCTEWVDIGMNLYGKGYVFRRNSVCLSKLNLE